MADDLKRLDDLLAKYGQQHVLAHWGKLNAAQQRALKEQIGLADFSRLDEMHRAIAELKNPPRRDITPAPVVELDIPNFPYAPGREAAAAAKVGEDALLAGEVACLLVAGGQGTRLGFDGPKGCYPVMPLSGMTLFEVFARKLLRVGKVYGKTPPLYVMVSRQNEQATRAFFEKNKFFGLKDADVSFFAQGEMPALDTDGKLILEAPDRLFLGPDGHGGVLSALHKTGMLANMRKRGVAHISYFQVDNLQVPVADTAFLGLHITRRADVSLKVVRKTDPAERVGIFCLDHGKPSVVEYTEFSDEQSRQRAAGGRLAFWAGSIAVHAFSLAFLESLAGRGADLPLHAAFKKVPFIDATGRLVEPASPNAYKFERFVFDTLPLAKTVAALEVARDEQFLPLKNPDGPFGPEGVRNSYQRYWRAAAKLAWRLDPPAIEVDPLWCENAREFIALDPPPPRDASKPLRLPESNK
ncbi:MAG: UDPGP type 1 family protein [Planctomycetes bacterium]|nr:UDPGP type 1 family protein [Planctomycetota bacterium]